MAFVSPANLALEDPVLHKSDTKEEVEILEPSHGIAPDGHLPSLSEYEYFAKLKRNAESGGFSGNG
jgi:hypothetical protein